jgi:hypothetical protein
MQPEWSGHPEVVPTIILFVLGGLISFLLLGYVFAFFW